MDDEKFHNKSQNETNRLPKKYDDISFDKLDK